MGEVKNSGGSSLKTFEFDGLNRRVSETASGTTRDLYYSAQWQVLEETVGGNTEWRYVWSPVYVDALVLRDRDTNADGSLDERLYVAQDANFNVVALLDTSGNVVERYTYSPFGVQTVYDASYTVRGGGSAYSFTHGFQGMAFDSVAGLNPQRFRWYSPTLGRWVTMDPIRYSAGDVNLYRAMSNNTVNRVDPSGLADKARVLPKKDWQKWMFNLVDTQNGYEGGTIGKIVQIYADMNHPAVVNPVTKENIPGAHYDVHYTDPYARNPDFVYKMRFHLNGTRFTDAEMEAFNSFQGNLLVIDRNLPTIFTTPARDPNLRPVILTSPSKPLVLEPLPGLQIWKPEKFLSTANDMPPFKPVTMLPHPVFDGSLLPTKMEKLKLPFDYAPLAVLPGKIEKLPLPSFSGIIEGSFWDAFPTTPAIPSLRWGFPFYLDPEFRPRPEPGDSGWLEFLIGPTV
jgi:RHS repeat-associated protein